MKKLLTLSLVLFVFLFIAGEALAKTKWDMHLNYPAGNFHSQGAQRFADRVSEARPSDPGYGSAVATTAGQPN